MIGRLFAIGLVIVAAVVVVRGLRPYVQEYVSPRVREYFAKRRASKLRAEGSDPKSWGA